MPIFDFPQWTDPQLPLDSGKAPRCRFSTPIRALVGGESFLTVRGEENKIHSCARRHGRTVSIKKVNETDCRVTIVR